MQIREDRSGHLHPLSQMITRVVNIFEEIGFSVAEGPEVETEFNNFDALNVPKDHPARDMQDTFWLKPNKLGDLLRTHTSPVQVRYMKSLPAGEPPLKIIVPGKVFRYEATDATHEAQFYQLEGLYVDREVSMAHLKAVLEHFLKKLFGDDVRIRLRPSFFPFVEPGVEVDMWFKDRWLEVMGAGLVHPNVFKAVGLDSDEWKGFAFGVGLDRLVMMKHGIDDIRLIYSGDTRFLKQF